MLKRWAAVLGAIVLMSCVVVAKDSGETEKTITDLEFSLGRAMIHKDIATLSNLVGDDWTIQSESGTMGTKAGFINDVRSGALVVTMFRIHDIHVHVLGNVAYVQAFDDEESSYKGKSNNGTYNWLDVWVNRDGHWVSVATQLTKVVDAKR